MVRELDPECTQQRRVMPDTTTDKLLSGVDFDQDDLQKKLNDISTIYGLSSVYLFNKRCFDITLNRIDEIITEEALNIIDILFEKERKTKLKLGIHDTPIHATSLKEKLHLQRGYDSVYMSVLGETKKNMMPEMIRSSEEVNLFIPSLCDNPSGFEERTFLFLPNTVRETPLPRPFAIDFTAEGVFRSRLGLPHISKDKEKKLKKAVQRYLRGKKPVRHTYPSTVITEDLLFQYLMLLTRSPGDPHRKNEAKRMLRDWTHNLAELAKMLDGEMGHMPENPESLQSSILAIMEILEELVFAEVGYDGDESDQSVDESVAQLGTVVRKLHKRLGEVPNFRRKFNGYPWRFFIPSQTASIDPIPSDSDSEYDESIDSRSFDDIFMKNKRHPSKSKTLAMKKTEDQLVTCTSSDSDYVIDLPIKKFDFLGDFIDPSTKFNYFGDLFSIAEK